MQKSDVLDEFFRNGGSVCPFAKAAADRDAIVYAENDPQFKDRLISFLTDPMKQVFIVYSPKTPSTHKKAKDRVYNLFKRTLTELIRIQAGGAPEEEITEYVHTQMAMFDDPRSSQRPMLGYDNKPMYAIGMGPNYATNHPRYAPVLCLVVTWLDDIQTAARRFPSILEKIRAKMIDAVGSLYDADELYLRRNPADDWGRNPDDLEQLELIIKARRLYQKLGNVTEVSRKLNIRWPLINYWTKDLQEQDVKIIQARLMREEGRSVKSIAEYFGVAWDTANKWLQNIPYTDPRRELARQLRQSRTSISEIARRLKASTRKIRSWITNIDITDPKIEAVRHLRRQGFSLNQISRETGVSFRVVRRWVEDIEPGQRVIPQHEKAKQLHETGKSYDEIAVIMNKPKTTVYRWIKNPDDLERLGMWVKDLIPEYRKRPAPRYNPLIITDKMKTYRKQRDVTHLFKMHPRDFLRLTTDDDDHIRDIRKSALSLQEYNDYDKITEYPIENDLYLDIQLNKSGTTGWVLNHEGRHRIAAVLNAGEDGVEISIKFYDDKYREITPTKMPKKLIHQMAINWRGLKARTVLMKDIKVKKIRRRNPDDLEHLEKIAEARSLYREGRGRNITSIARQLHVDFYSVREWVEDLIPPPPRRKKLPTKKKQDETCRGCGRELERTRGRGRPPLYCKNCLKSSPRKSELKDQAALECRKCGKTISQRRIGRNRIYCNKCRPTRPEKLRPPKCALCGVELERSRGRGRPRLYCEDCQSRPNPSVTELEALRSDFCEAAQAVYDNWDQDVEGHCDEYAHGGICHDIAEAICDVLYKNEIGCTTFSPSIGDVHVWAVADIEGEAYRVDIIPYLYEQGGGYTWKKIPDIIFEDDDIIIESMGYPFSDYLED